MPGKKKNTRTDETLAKSAATAPKAGRAPKAAVSAAKAGRVPKAAASASKARRKTPTAKTAISPSMRDANAVSAPTAIRLFRVADEVSGRAALAEGFEPVALVESANHLPMLDAMRRLSVDHSMGDVALWGLMAADFVQKTGLTAAALREEIARHPACDVYFCHPFPELEGVYHSPWMHAEFVRPGFIDISREFFSAVGFAESTVSAFTHSTLFTTGMHMVATPRFWSEFLAFADKLLSLAKQKMSATSRDRLFKEVFVEGKYTLLYLISVRLLGVFLMMKDKQWRVCKIPLPAAEKKLNIHLRLLREMKDVALVRKSTWMLACWANYRNLYLLQAMGQEWVAKSVKATNPGSSAMAIPSVDISYPYMVAGETGWAQAQ